jgi:hypothetical protein
MASRARVEHELFVAQARLLTLEIETEVWLRSRHEPALGPPESTEPGSPAGEDFLDWEPGIQIRTIP